MLTRTSNPDTCSVLAPEFPYGTCPDSLREVAKDSPAPSRAFRAMLSPRWAFPPFYATQFRPRTSVLNLPIPLRHRFFFPPPAHFPCDRLFPLPSFPSPSVAVDYFLAGGRSGFNLDPTRRHARHRAQRSRRRLLLQLLSLQSETGLRKNV